MPRGEAKKAGSMIVETIAQHSFPQIHSCNRSGAAKLTEAVKYRAPSKVRSQAGAWEYWTFSHLDCRGSRRTHS